MTETTVDNLIGENEAESRRILDFAENLCGKSVVWGEDDCSAFPAKYLSSRGVNIQIPVYSTEEQAQEIVNKYGDLAGVWSAIAERSDVYEIEPNDVKAGDVGVIRVSTLGASHGFQVGAIFIRYGLGAIIRAEPLNADSPGIRILGIRRNTIVKVWRAT